MKTVKALLLLVLASLTLGICSCSKDDEHEGSHIVEFYPVAFYISLADSAGKDLLDDCSPEFFEGFSMEHNGEMYPVEMNWESTRMIIASPFQKFVYHYFEESKKHYLIFGVFDGSYCNESMELNMPNGNQHKISINRDAYYDYKKHKIIVNQTVMVDDQIMDEYTDQNPDIMLTFEYNPTN